MGKIAIFSQDCSFFAVPYLAEAIGCDLYVADIQHNNFFGGEVVAKQWDGNPIDCEHLIIVSGYALKVIKLGNHKTISAIMCDTMAFKEHKWCSKFIEDYGIFSYAMPDKTPYYPNAIPVYQTMQIRCSIKEKPTDRLVIAHSPSCDYKAVEKGTPQIIDVIKKLKMSYDFDFILIKGMSMSECLSLKSTSHIFIDQLTYKNSTINNFNGGLGKSGIEGILLGCCVITGGIPPKTEPYFPTPPIVWTSYDVFLKDLERIIADKIYRQSITVEQKIWADKYISAEFVAKHVTQHIV